MGKDISVIVPAYNEEDNIASCLKSVLKQDYPKKNYEIIVVDGNSSDKTAKIAEKYADKVIKQEEKTGPGLSRNKGVKNSKGKILVFLDADTWIISDNFFKEIIKNKQGFIGGAPIINLETNSWLLKNYYNLVTNKANQVADKLGLNKLITPYTTCCFYKRKIFLELGGFKKFTWDDIELYYRARKKGRFCWLNKTRVKTSDRKYHLLFKKMGKLRTLIFYTFSPFFETLKFSRGVKSKKLKRVNYFKR